MQAQESKVVSDSGPSSASKPKGPRLVIRVKISPEPPPPPPPPSITPRVAGISAAVVALLTLGWLGINASKDEYVSSSITTAQGDSPSQSAPASPNSVDSGGAGSADAAAADVSPNIQLVGGARPSAVPSGPAVPEPVNEVIPDTPRSALQTITGTVRVAIRVDIDSAGNVSATHSEIPGPSRYFERLSREAATQWTFTPTTSDAPRTMLLRFFYKRDGVTAESAQPN